MGRAGRACLDHARLKLIQLFKDGQTLDTYMSSGHMYVNVHDTLYVHLDTSTDIYVHLFI